MGSQGVLAEEQPFQAEGMDFAFDDAQVASVQMSELSGSEMDETEGAYGPVDAVIGGGSGLYGGGYSYIAAGGRDPYGFVNSALGGAWGGAVSGAISPTPITAAGAGFASGVATGTYNAATGN
jgi:Zn-dependent protease